MIIGFIMILLAIMVIALLHLFITKNSCTRIIIMTSVCHRVVEVVIVGVVAAAVAVAVTAAFFDYCLDDDYHDSDADADGDEISSDERHPGFLVADTA